MNRLLGKFTKKNKAHFLNRNEHNWIHEHPLVSETFNRVHSTTKNHKNISACLEKIVFIHSNGQFACAINADVNIIIIFPELLFLMKHGRIDQAIAIILHEMGHIILEHQKNNTPNDQAQIEADLFAAGLGHGVALYEFLLSQNQSNQIKTRVTALRKVVNLNQ